MVRGALSASLRNSSLAFRFRALVGLGSGVVESVGEAVGLSPVIWARRSPIGMLMAWRRCLGK